MVLQIRESTQASIRNRFGNFFSKKKCMNLENSIKKVAFLNYCYELAETDTNSFTVFIRSKSTPCARHQNSNISFFLIDIIFGLFMVLPPMNLSKSKKSKTINRSNLYFQPTINRVHLFNYSFIQSLWSYSLYPFT